MLVQVDGSHHRWLGDDGPPFALLLAVDDATGTVVNALFCEQENTRDYFLLMRELIQRHGIPIALYTDRHSVFKNVPGSGHAGAPTQFSRAMDELGVQMVFALSPQAKGRVERTAGTFQDRLVTELRLAGATTIEEANVLLKEFLDRFNARFGVAAQHPEAAYRPLGSGVCLDTVLCFRHSRRVARDNTVKYRWRTLQLLPGTERRSYAGAAVDVLEGLDGQLAVRYQGEIIASQEAPPRPGILRSFNGSSSHGTPPRPDLNGLSRRWEAALAALDAQMDAGDADDTAIDTPLVRFHTALDILDRFHGRRASGRCPYDDSRIMEKWRSTMPVNSITPMATIHTTKATPVIRCMIVAASTHISCIPIPISADAGAMRLMRPPAFHCRCAAASSANPAAPNPSLPVTHRSRAAASVEESTVFRAATSKAPGAATASRRAQMPEAAVAAPDVANR